MGIDLLLINPGARKKIYKELGKDLSGIEIPYWCAITASFIIEKGYSCEIIDCDADSLEIEETVEKTVKKNPSLVYIIVMGTNPSASSTPKMIETKQIVDGIKKKNPMMKIAIGGIHPSSLPEKTLKEENVDFIIYGEGFYTVYELLNVLKTKNLEKLNEVKGLWYKKNNKIYNTQPAPLIKNLDELPYIKWDLFSFDKYRAHNWHCLSNLDKRTPYGIIYTSFGCPYNCFYCNIHALYNERPSIRYFSPERVVKEIEILVEKYKVRNLKIADELFVLNRERVLKICDLLIKKRYDLNIWAYARIDTVDEEILKKLKESGVNWLCYGIESANQKVREGVNKKISQEKIEKVIEMTKKAGIYILGNFIFGLPDDNYETMNETLKLAKKLMCEYVNFYVAMAYPGSLLYKESIQKGIKLPQTWSGFAQLSEDTLPLPTKYLKPEEVLKFRDHAFIDYFSDPQYLKMIEKKFGEQAKKHIEDIIKIKIKRKYV